MINLISPLTNVFAQGKWVTLDSNTRLTLSKIFCTDSLNCWAAGDSGLIIHTSDGGINWIVQNTGVSEHIQDIFFLNNRIGWAVSARFDSVFGSYFIKTINGGKDWEKEFFNIENKYFHTIFFQDSLSGWVAGGPSECFYGTSDGGSNWFSPKFDSLTGLGLSVQKIIFFSKQYGFACGGVHDGFGVIWKTSDYGLSWSSKRMGLEPLRDLCFLDSLNIIGVGGDYEYGTAVASTSDGGENWIYELPGYFNTATGISSRSKNEIWACIGGEHKFIVSIDSGKTWNSFNTLNESAIYDLVFTDSLHGYAVGDSGVILKYKHDYISDIAQNKTTLPLTINLFQNYPNPFNPSTKISWSSSVDTRQSLKIYDLLGNEVVILLDEYKPAGNYEVEFSSAGGSKSSFRNLASGVYFYQLKAGSFVKTMKMILMR